MKDEIRYKNTLNYRLNQSIFWEYANIVHTFISDIVKIKAKYPNIKYLRFNESGDIRGTNDLSKMCFIARWLKELHIKVYTYTASKQLFPLNWFKLSNQLKQINKLSHNNLVINGSGFMLHNNYKVNNSNTITSNNSIPIYKICCGSCVNCNYCKTATNSVINTKLR
ncbi:unnamed protein product [marine sediment metagenome]|uniref:Uncharacterized protein n=1 Tax=marine sediment metagenome TaxID=412755 RepID=X0UZY7_9ZZZZ